MHVHRILGSVVILCLITSTILAHSINPAEGETPPIYLRLRFDKGPLPSDSVSYLWERRILSDLDKYSSWAEESTATDTRWEPVDELPRKVKVGVALAGGGLRGATHIGVLRALEENNIPIHGISGTSMGAIVGGFYACGFSVDTLEYIVKNDIDWEAIFRDQPPRQTMPMWARLREKPREPAVDLEATGTWWLPFSYQPEIGIRVAQGFTDEIAERTLEADYRSGFRFDSLPVPFGAILTNVKTGRSELMTEGTISTAARASGSAPIYLEPMRIRGVPYADGAILDDLPVDAFIPFDPSRAPDKTLSITGENEALYVIAVYPLKRRGVRETVEEPSLAGPFGLGVMGRTRGLARDVHIWNSWDAAHGKIDVDIAGWFDFSPQVLEDVIRAGYDAGWKEIREIKGGIAALEDSLRHSGHNRRIYRLSSITLLHIAESDTTVLREGKERERIISAIRFKEGSYLEKVDVCDALRRVHALGTFENVKARIDTRDSELMLTFFLDKKKNYRNPLEIIVKGATGVGCDSVLKEAVTGHGSVLNFGEVKELIERHLIEQGFVSPRVDRVRFHPMEGGVDTLSVHINGRTRLRGVKVVCDRTNDTRMEEALASEFNKPFSPNEILYKTEYVRREYQLKTIAVEGMKGDSLIVAARKKSTHTLEFPALSLEIFEGFNFFTEVRNRRIRRFFDWSIYANYAQNFPLKVAEELPRGQKLAVGRERGRSLPFIPDMRLHWMALRFPSSRDTSVYDMKFAEVAGQLSFPMYKGSYAFIPGFEMSQVTTYPLHGEKGWRRQNTAILWLRHDDLDRIVFPESGWKADIDTKLDVEKNAWQRARARLTWVPFKWRIQNKVMTVLTLRGFGSWYSEETPDHERYSLGGITPVGSYQLSLRDAEDLPGHTKEELVEPVMWKAGCSGRLAFLERSLLGLRANAHLEGSVYIADAIPKGEPNYSSERVMICPSGGVFLDTSFLNMGLVFKGTRRNFYHHVYLGVVLYGLGL